MVEWQITNMVFSIKFDTNFSIDKIAAKLIDKGVLADYDPNSFPGLFITLENKKGKVKKVTVFRSGAILIYGLKRIDEVYDIIKEIKKMFNKYDIYLPDNYEIRLNNVIIVGRFDYTNIDIERMYNDFDDARYDPEQFPAISIPYYLSENYKVTFNVFRDGHFVCAGIKGDLNNINQTIDNIVNSFQENVIKKYVRAINL